MSKSTYRNVDAMPTWKLKEILNDPYTRGIDGADYEPVREYLEQALWARYAKEDQLFHDQCRREEKQYQKHIATAHKRKRTA